MYIYIYMQEESVYENGVCLCLYGTLNIVYMPIPN